MYDGSDDSSHSHGHLRVHHARALRRIVEIAPRNDRHRGIEAAVHDHHLARRVRGEPYRLVDEVLVGNRLAAAHSGIRGDHHLRRRVVDPRGEARRGEAAEDHRVDRADARAGEHGERRLGDHRHVDQHAIAAPHVLRLEDGREPVHLGGKLAVGVAPVLAGLGRDIDQRRLVAARGEMSIDRVVAEIDPPADEPLRERRSRVIEHRAERRLPVDERGFAAPECLAVGDRAAMQFAVSGHRSFSSPPPRHARAPGAARHCAASRSGGV